MVSLSWLHFTCSVCCLPTDKDGATHSILTLKLVVPLTKDPEDPQQISHDLGCLLVLFDHEGILATPMFTEAFSRPRWSLGILGQGCG